MKQLFNQGGQGSTGIMSNKQAIARRFGVKQSEVVYFSSGQALTGFKVIYDKPSQRAYALPSNLGSVTATTLVDGLLTHSGGTVDLGALAVLREEFVTLVENFTSGFTIRVKNELVSDGQSLYRWDGVLPKTVNAGGSVSSDGVGKGKWVETSTSNLSYFPKPITWAGFAGGADSTGVIDSAAAFNAAYTAGEGNGIAILTPAGTYKVATNTYEVESDALWLSRDFRGGVSVVSSARSTPLNITIGTPDEPVNSGIYGRSGINITAVARGGQHANCIRTTLDNRSTDGNGNPSIYAAGLSYSTALWTAALHGETKHGGGTTIAASIEAASYTDKGTFYGIVLNNTSGNAQLNHPTTGSPITTHPLATALYVVGSDSRGDAGMWLRGIRFNSGSLRSGGTVLLDESNSFYGYCSASSSSKSGADIFLAGTAPQGIIIQGTYSSGNGIRLSSGIGIAYEGTGVIKTKYDKSTLRWGLYNGLSERVTFNTTTPGIYLNGVKVLTTQQPAIPNATESTMLDTLNLVISMLRVHGLIAQS